MKIHWTLLGLALLGGLAWLLLRSPAADHHGNPFRNLPAVEIGALADRPAEHVRKEVRIEGTLGRQCPASGCWFFLRGKDGKEVKVEMGDTTPSLPQRTGKTAVVEGQLIPYGDAYEFIGTAVEFR